MGIGTSTYTPEHSLDVGGLEEESNHVCPATVETEILNVAHGGSTTNATNGVAGAIGLYYTNSYENSMVRFHRGSGGTGGYMSFTVNNGRENEIKCERLPGHR